MKDNYPTDKENNFRNIKKFVQVDHLEKIRKTTSFFRFPAPGKLPVR
jgi:hypothetical protein